MPEALTTLFGANAGSLTVLNTLIATFVIALSAHLVASKLKQRSARTKNLWDDALIHALGLPIQALIWVVGFGLAFQVSQFGVETPAEDVVIAARDLGVIASITWFSIRFVNFAQANFLDRKKDSGVKVDQSILNGSGKLIRLLIYIATVLVAMQTLGFSISGVLTFGGIGGIAIGFAAKDMLANFFGGLMIFLDRPFLTGDWVRSPDREIEGVVEEIGWRMTQIRTFDSRPLYVPNSSFATISIENVSRMTNRRIHETIGIRYDDATSMDSIVTQTKEYLNGHPDIDQSQSVMVSFTTFSASSLDFFIYCYTKTKSGPTFYKIKQEIMLHVLNIIESNNAECAFPTTTIHWQQPETPPEKLAR